MSLKGIDISAAQGSIDVSGLPVDFVVIKATGGNGYVNPQCDTNYQQAKNGGKLRGVYHYYSDGFGGDDPIAEANWFVDNIQGYVGDAILVLDWERGGNPHVNEVDKAKAFLDHVVFRTGVKPVIYMSASLVSEMDWSPVINGDYGLWVAAYPYNSTPITDFQIDPNLDPNPSWGAVGDIMWQFTSTGRIAGYYGNLDCDLFYGDANTWNAYKAVPVPVQPPVMPTVPTVPTPEPAPIVPPVEPPIVIPPVVTPPVVPQPEPITPPVVPPKKNWLSRLINAILYFFDIKVKKP